MDVRVDAHHHIVAAHELDGEALAHQVDGGLGEVLQHTLGHLFGNEHVFVVNLAGQSLDVGSLQHLVHGNGLAFSSEGLDAIVNANIVVKHSLKSFNCYY